MSVDTARKLLLVSSLGRKRVSEAAVLAFPLSDLGNNESKPAALTMRAPGLVHPTGIITARGKYYVAEQTRRALMTFESSSGRYLETLVENLPDAPEGLLLASETSSSPSGASGR